jgi:hypothetical protein
MTAKKPRHGVDLAEALAFQERFRAPEANKSEVFANRIAATELLTKNACNRLLQQNRHLADIDSSALMSAIGGKADMDFAAGHIRQ